VLNQVLLGRRAGDLDDQIARLREAAMAGSDVDLPLFIEIALGTSMRHNEILRMKWGDLDLANRRLRIPQAKAGARMQPITAGLAELLAQEQDMRVDQEGWIFPSRYHNATVGCRRDMGRPFRRAVQTAGLDPRLVTPHTLRHTVVSRLVMAGVDLPTVQQVSGHKTITMVLRYAHVHAPHIDAAMATIDYVGKITPKLHQTAAGVGAQRAKTRASD